MLVRPTKLVHVCQSSLIEVMEVEVITGWPVPLEWQVLVSILPRQYFFRAYKTNRAMYCTTPSLILVAWSAALVLEVLSYVSPWLMHAYRMNRYTLALPVCPDALMGTWYDWLTCSSWMGVGSVWFSLAVHGSWCVCVCKLIVSVIGWGDWRWRNAIVLHELFLLSDQCRSAFFFPDSVWFMASSSYMLV